MSTASTSHRVLARLLGAFSDVLLTAGILLGLFIGWLLFYTDIQAGQQQSVIVTQQAQQWGGVPDRIAPELREDIPITDPPAAEGTVWGVMHIPNMERTSVPIATGTDLETVLNRLGMGWYPSTQRPGEVGNFAMAGHRTTYGKPLADIDVLRPDDPIVVETKDYFYVYRVADHSIVQPDASEVIAPVPGDRTFASKPTKRMLTLTACHPRYSLAQRYIVHAELDYYTRRSDGVPPTLAGTGIIQTTTTGAAR